jgi:LysM repeat protein
MSKNYLQVLLFTFLFTQALSGKSIVDCRVITGVITECNPYGEKLHHVKEVLYDIDRQKLIIEKTLPVPKKKKYVKVISVADMIEKYVKVEEPVRFKGTDSESVTISIVEIPLNHKVIEKKIEKLVIPKKVSTYGTYVVVKGDALSKIAKKLGLSTKKIMKLNGLNKSSTLRIGQKLKVPLTQEMVDALTSATYTVKEGDTLLSISKKFKLDAKKIVSFNHIKDATVVRTGKKLKLPLPYVLAKIEAKQRKEDSKGLGKNLNINAFGKHKLRVTATAYTSHGNQTDSTPFLAAWNNRLRPGMKSIAVSRDMLTRYGMRNGTKVRIGGLRGYYRVRDKMNKRYRKRIDIYMGLDRRRALRWGRRSVVIYW